ncbi:2-C-methyl-D-erythritol 4-phosphate cytidylyltransferase, partial [Vicingaceae bacterium]|nr:2-C-methyl-D-erythritol 4-phosphate cytidylyltransferase [Vicingaceae bacterium]
RKVDSDQSVAVNRSNFKIVQTPQCFDVNVLKQAYQQVFNSSFTDDASVVEADGKKVSLVKGNYSNIKITTIEDLKIAEILM